MVVNGGYDEPKEVFKKMHSEQFSDAKTTIHNLSIAK